MRSTPHHCSAGWGLFTALLLAACSSSSGGVDAGDAGLDGDGGVGGSGGGASDGFGARCESDTDCAANLVCDVEMDQSFTANNLPPGVTEVPSAAFPDGSCSPVQAGPVDPTAGGPCDPTLAGTGQGCGADGACVPVAVVSGNALATWFACRPSCDPTDPLGCGRFGYACDFVYQACVEGCQSDEECRIVFTDTNMDGTRELEYDDTSDAFCDPVTFRCTHPGTGGDTGDPCSRLDDCEPDGACVEALTSFGGFTWPDGYCVKQGCDFEGRECSGSGSVCMRLRGWEPGIFTSYTCLQGCTVGAEPEADRVGTAGHGEGCRAGYRCHYNGGVGAESGVCVGGNYNAVAESNIGAACETHDECYSPYGLGQCLFLSVGIVAAPTGVCTLMDCAVPGIPDDICGAGAECLGLSEDRTFCASTCTDATQCAEGSACADDDADPTTAKVCFPACFADEDCVKDEEECRFLLDPSTGTSTTYGQCTPI